LVVDDGSADETSEAARSAGATVVRQEPNQGKGAALRTGFRWALDNGYRAVVTLDADGQHDPSEIPKFVRVYRDHGADLVIGERDFSLMPPLRRLSNSLGRWAFSWTVGQAVADNQSGYRLVSRAMMEAALASDERGFEFEVEMIVIAVRRGLRLGSAPIRTIYGDEKSHINNWRHFRKFVGLMWRTRRAMRRADRD